MATTNGRYAAYTRHGKVYIEDLTSSEPGLEAQCPRIPPVLAYSALSFSTLQPDILAISSGSQILVFDVATGKLEKTIGGLGRTITALSWSPVHKALLVSGAVDGSLALWDLGLDIASSPAAQLRLHGACQAIACCPTDTKLFAAINDGRIIISKRDPSISWRLLGTIALGDDAIRSLAWHPANSRTLLTGTRSGKVSLWDISAVVETTAPMTNGYDGDSSDSDDGFFSNLDGLENLAHPIFELSLAGPVSHVQWAGNIGFTCLSRRAMKCSIYSWQEGSEEAVELWFKDMDHPALHLAVTVQSEHSFVVVASSHGSSSMELSQDIVGQVGLVLTHDEGGDATQAPAKLELERPRQQAATEGMTPISIPTLRSAKGGFARTSRQLQHRKPSFERQRDRRKSGSQLDTRRDGPPSPPPLHSMTSSLELPNQRDEEGSPMPFLSPSIPSRKPSPGDLAPLDDSIKLPPLPRASFDSSVQSTSAANQDSDDSDDETFVDRMQGSASFLPGGINVPLPKACAALFTPTGELLTFFPPKPKLAPSKRETPEEKQSDPKASARKVARLFPSFGNLSGGLKHSDNDDDSGFESSSSFSADEGPLRVRPGFSFYPSSFPSQQSWKARISPTKHSLTEQHPHKIIVTLHDIAGIDSLLPASRQLASKYRILCEPEQDAADLCRHNATMTEELGLGNVTEIWLLVALLLEDRAPLEASYGGHIGDDALKLARAADLLVRKGMQNTTPGSQRPRRAEKVRWSNNSFGTVWIVRAIFDWAESRADTQLLAVLSVILARTQGDGSTNHSLSEQTFKTPSPAHQQDYFISARNTVQSQALANQSVPIFRTNSEVSNNVQYESPLKPRHPSAASSRNQSQPTTPYLESQSSTPPFLVSALGRQSTRLSASGSASPEHHRSSFSAAAKYYAQSISDKFASYGAYGTSPPARKLGISPSNTNEFSTSFPSGSWGKSVSFASTTHMTKAGLLSTSFEDVQEDEGYDSDKTVEDLSQPQTPRDNNDCIVTFKNDRLLDDDTFGGNKATLLSDDMIQKCRLWCEYYADQLRCWNLLLQAAELEKVCGMTCLRRPSEEYPSHEEEPSIVPMIAPRGSKACSICSIKMTGAQFFCSQCSHSAHLACLEDFIKALCTDEEEYAFACPAGCGCQCDTTPFQVAVAQPLAR